MGQWDYTFTKGELIYVDSFRGIVPAKLLGQTRDGDALVKVTSARPAFPKGETYVPMRDVIQRGALKRRKHGSRITNYSYKWDNIPTVE